MRDGQGEVMHGCSRLPEPPGQGAQELSCPGICGLWADRDRDWMAVKMATAWECFREFHPTAP